MAENPVETADKGLIPKSEFIGLENIVHLCTGGESPVLKSHREAIDRFLADKALGETSRKKMDDAVNRCKAKAGQLLGVKTVLNELIAYAQLAALPPEALAPRSRLILTYALCGFANLGSLGIMIGGLATLVPERRAEVVAHGPLAVAAGLLATCMTGAVVGLIELP